MKICPKCGSGNVVIKTSEITEYHDAEIQIEAKITEDDRVDIKFKPEGSYYLNDEGEPIMIVCEHGHKTKLYDLDEDLISILSEALSVNSEEHICVRKLEVE